jgi:serine/threonine protein kinase
MGEVYKARDTHLERVVAIEILPPQMLSDSDRKQRFIREARAASSLNHPNIITVHDIACEEGVDLMVMEFVAGKTLGQLIGHRGLKVEDGLRPPQSSRPSATEGPSTRGGSPQRGWGGS